MQELYSAAYKSMGGDKKVTLKMTSGGKKAVAGNIILAAVTLFLGTIAGSYSHIEWSQWNRSKHEALQKQESVPYELSDLHYIFSAKQLPARFPPEQELLKDELNTEQDANATIDDVRGEEPSLAPASESNILSEADDTAMAESEDTYSDLTTKQLLKKALRDQQLEERPGASSRQNNE